MLKLKHIPGQSALSDLGAKSSAVPEGSSGAVSVNDLGFVDKINLRCKADNAFIQSALNRTVGVELPPYNRFHTAGKRSCIWLGPDEWLILAENGDADDIMPELDTPKAGHVAVTEVSDAFGAITMSGAHIRDVLAKNCGLDLHPSVFSKGMVAQTLLGHTSIILTCLEKDKMMIIGRTSFMPYIVTLLEDSALEYGFIYTSAD